jgi:hypothetical protein
MKLKFWPIDSFAKVVANLEQLAQELTNVSSTRPKVTRGTSSVTFTASTDSGGTVVPHGLGVTPTAIVITGTAPTFGSVSAWNYYNVGATQFSVNARAPTTHTGAVDFSWVAVA